MIKDEYTNIEDLVGVISKSLSINKESFANMLENMNEHGDELVQIVKANIPEIVEDFFYHIAEERVNEIKHLTYGESPELMEMVLRKYIAAMLLTGTVFSICCISSKVLEEQQEKDKKGKI